MEHYKLPFIYDQPSTMDSGSSFDSCNREVFPEVARQENIRPELEEFTHCRITTLPPHPLEYINDLKDKLEEKKFLIWQINFEKGMLEERNKSMEAKILELEAEIVERCNELEGLRRIASKDDYQRLSEVVDELKSEALTRYQQYLDEKVHNRVGVRLQKEGRRGWTTPLLVTSKLYDTILV